MKLNFYLPCILLFVCAFGQNLVPNPGFESNTSCPTTYSQANLATGWYKSLVNNISPHHTDYMNSCNMGSFSTPWNTWGTQVPYEGNGYMILATASPNIGINYRENIYAQLSTPLVPGMMYQMIMHVNLTDNSKYATNRMGFKFSTTTFFPIDNVMQLSSPGVVNNRTSWVTISGTFTADSAYEYVGIGNFYTDALTSIVLDCPSCAYNLMGYAIDYICVSRINGGGADCSVITSVDPSEFNDSLTILPNPVTGNSFNINESLQLIGSKVKVTDMLGKSYMLTCQQNGERSCECEVPDNMPNGIYMLSTGASSSLFRFLISR